MPIHADNLSTATDLALQCLISRLVWIHVEPSEAFPEAYLRLEYPQWANELPGMSYEDAIALLEAATKTLRLRMEGSSND
jgi:hypothetical protein